jgi:hypothetical protein
MSCSSAAAVRYGRAAARGYAEMQRIIREEEPPKPSTKVGALGENASEVAGRRQTDAGNLRGSSP